MTETIRRRRRHQRRRDGRRRPARRSDARRAARDRRALPAGALGAAADAAPRAERRGLRHRRAASRPAPRSSGITTAEVSAVATFYTMYKRRPVGDYHVGVCTNTLCAVMGGDAIFERLKDHLDVGNDETTDDGKVTLEHVECNAACDYAPVVMVNWEFFDNQTPESADAARRRPARRRARSTPPAAPRICTWREAERVLAGFPDDRADEGPAAGPASLVGLSSPASSGWTAPTSTRRSGPPRGDAAEGDTRRQGRGQRRRRRPSPRPRSRSPAPTPSTRTTRRTRGGRDR